VAITPETIADAKEFLWNPSKLEEPQALVGMSTYYISAEVEYNDGSKEILPSNRNHAFEITSSVPAQASRRISDLTVVFESIIPLN